MATKAEIREFGDFVNALARNGVQHPTDEALELARLARRHHRLAERHCNGDCRSCGEEAGWPDVCKADERLEARIEKRAAALGFKVQFGGDPRGYTVSLVLPDGSYNSWGGKESGYGVPTC